MQHNTTASELTESHNAIQTCINNRDYHSAHLWARDAQNIELYLNTDVFISDDRKTYARQYMNHL